MAAISYPSIPNFYDPEAVMQATQRGYQSGVDYKNEKNAQSAFGQYLSSLYGQQQGAPQGVSPQPAQFGPSAPVGAVQRQPLAAPLDPASARVEGAFAAQGQGTSPTAIAGRFLKTVKDGGLNNPYALAAVAATGKNESGFAPERAFGTWSDPSQSGQAGTSGGIMSWRGDRLAKLQQFAQQNGDDPNKPSPEIQGKFLLAEDPSLIQKLNAAQSPAEAQQIMNQAWKFAGYDQTGGEAGQRIADAQAYAPQFGGSGGPAPSQQALESLAVGQSAPMGNAPQQAPMAAPQPQQAASILPPREVMAELFKSPGTRPLAIQLVQAAQGLKLDQNDPEKQIAYQIAVEKLKALRDPQSKLINAGGGSIYDPNTKQWISPPEGTGAGKGKFGNNVVWGQDDAGNWVAMQPSSAGGLELAPTPKGVKLSPPGMSNLDLGTQYGMRDRNGQVINTVPIDNAGKAAAAAQGKIEGEANANPTRVAAQATLGSTLSSLDRLGNAAQDIAADPSLGSITGWRGLIPNRPGGQAASVQARLNTMKTQIGFTVLQAMRDASKTGGALGAISDRENEMLQNALASLDQAQSEDDLKRELGKITDYVQGAKQRLQSAYEQTYGGQPQGSGTTQPAGDGWQDLGNGIRVRKVQ
ncbi:hypothetical protein CK227_10485 [Mesorhizobium sp. WSM4308]|uniref:phage tail tip lysozyme n=1 Tax=Mesorhizobium sp. WSM4308 TaxID=2029409 RepID=UPI000BB08DB3|nr:phage tail tip lysozyme [Mesorhizobium sp. WSM4308]PBB75210.1 hypothetical protein CK227_10485 [Mesorhizobium sp. WSM4308]